MPPGSLDELPPQATSVPLSVRIRTGDIGKIELRFCMEKPFAASVVIGCEAVAPAEANDGTRMLRYNIPYGV